MSDINLTSSTSSDEAQFSLAHSGLSTLETTLFLCYVIPLILFILTSNSFVIYAVLTYKPLKNPSNLYLLSLAVTDLMAGIFIVPMAGQYNVVGVWKFGVIGCQLWTKVTYYLDNSSIYHLCAIALDRYLAMAKPLSYVKKRSNRKSLLIISFVWMWSLLVMLPSIGMEMEIEWQPEVYHCAPPQDRKHAIYTALTSFYMPLLVLVAIYMRVFLLNRSRLKRKIRLSSARLSVMAVASSARVRVGESANDWDNAVVLEEEENEEERVVMQIAEGSKRRLLVRLTTDLHAKIMTAPELRCPQCQVGIPTSNDSNLCQICASPNDLLLAAEKSRLAILMRRERRSMFVITIIVFTFILCWMPGWTLFLILNVDPSVTVDSWLVSLAWWLTYSNSACNPIIYTIFNRDFRAAFHRIVGLH